MQRAADDANEKATLLVVDDEPANLALLATLLHASYRVRAANNGARAIAAAGTAPRPDLILLDVMMPDLDGHAVLARLQRDPSTRDIPVIFVTTLDDSVDEERGLALGAVDYISKPIRPAVLLARIRTQLALKVSRDELARHNASLEAEVERRTRENELIQDVSLSIIAGLVETRDTETGNHTVRTQAYVEVLAKHLQQNPAYASDLSDEAVVRLVKSAPLHDIGKIGIRDTILLKPGPLTRDEVDIMRTHARLGGEAIAQAIRRVVELRASSGPAHASASPSALAFLETAREIALWHHERWDGAGYPDRLAGEQIPVSARLMAVADVFDALTTRRVYKPAMPTDDAVTLIVSGRGTQFDPGVVDAFVAVLPELSAIQRRYADAAG